MIEGCKQTEVGMIPEDWDIAALSGLVDESRSIRYGIVQPGKFDPQGRYMIRGQDYSRGWVAPPDLFRVSPGVEEAFSNARVRAGDVLMTIVGASTGRVAVVPDWLNGANLTQTTARIAIDGSRADSSYCSHVLSSWCGVRQVQQYIKGGAQPGLNCGDIEKFKIPLPPTKAEQESIAEALGDADVLIESLEQLLAKKRHLKQGAMQELLNGKRRLPGFEVKPGYRQTEVGIIPKDWEVRAIEDFASIKTGPFGTLLKASEYATGEGVPLISVGEIREGFFRVTGNTPRVSETVTKRLPQYVLRTGDIVFGRKGGIDRSALIRHRQDGWFLGSDGIAIRPLPTCDHEYLAHQFQNSRVQNWLKQNAIGTTMPSLNQEILGRVEIPLPPTKPEQEAISEILSDIDLEVGQLDAKLAKSQKLKRGMMQELLTGRVRLA